MVDKATDLSYTVPLLIDGKEVTTKTTFTVTSPVSNKPIWQSSSASLEDVEAAVTAAKASFPLWAKMKPAAKRDIFLRAANIMEARRAELSNYMEVETGALPMVSSRFNLPKTVEMLRDVAGRVTTVMGHIPTSEEEGTGSLIVKEPLGVVLAIAPWNSPYILGMRSVLYPLAAGNTVVAKFSEICPRTLGAIGSIFIEAGLPAGVLNILFHQTKDAAQITKALIENPVIKKINFTGSTHVGSIIAALAGKNLKPVLMELGGKASAIILDDADLQKAAMNCTLGAFLHAGQACMSTERILVHRSVKAPFLRAFKSAIEETFGKGKPASILVNDVAVTRNRELILAAVDGGAEVIHGDPTGIEVNPETNETSGTRMRPTVVDGVNKSMGLFYTETFGPTVSIVEITSDEEAVEIANDTEYGLTAAIFTEDLRRGLRIAKQIESGAVHINSMTIHDEWSLPHGGAKASGFGRFNGNWGIEEFLRLKSITYQE